MKLVNVLAMLRTLSSLTVRAISRKEALPALATVLLVGSPFCFAQVQVANLSSTIELARADLTSQRNAIIGASMQLKDKDAAAFWPIYRKYEYERSVVDDGRAAVIKTYAQNYSILSGADAKSMTEKMIEYDAREIALKRKYFKEFSKVLTPITVAEFFQLDHRVDILVAVAVESSLPPLAGVQNTDNKGALQQSISPQDNQQSSRP